MKLKKVWDKLKKLWDAITTIVLLISMIFSFPLLVFCLIRDSYDYYLISIENGIGSLFFVLFMITIFGYTLMMFLYIIKILKDGIKEIKNEIIKRA
jgi:hypothetical protein